MNNDKKLKWERSLFETPAFEEREFKDLPKNVRGGYLVNTVNGVTKKTFAFYGLPSDVHGKIPAAVLVHGAGGNAFYEWVIKWTQRGYAAIAIDINYTEFLSGDPVNRVHNPYLGELDVGGFGSVGKDPYDSWVYYSVAQIISAGSFIGSLPEVDNEKIGLAGISWGGVMSLIALAEDARFAVGAIIYSAGFITDDVLGIETGLFNDKNNKEFYDDYFDPKSYVDKISVPVLFNGGLKDGAFSPFSRQKTYRLIGDNVRVAVIDDLYHDNESNFENENVFEFFGDALSGNLKKKYIKCTLSGNRLSVITDKDAKTVEVYTTENAGNPHTFVWKKTSIVLNGGKTEYILPEKTTYVAATAFYENGVYIGGDILTVGETCL